MRLAKTVRAAVLVAVTSLPLLGTPPASATTVGVVEFAGTALLPCPGLGYPGTDPGFPPLSTDLTPNNCPFLFYSTIFCSDQIANVGKERKPPVVAGPGCDVVATGTVTGFCGLSYGKGMGTFRDSTGNAVNIPSFSFTGVAHKLVVTGVVEKPSTGQKGFLSGVVEAAGPTPFLTPTGGSCFAKTATVITLAGAVSFALT